MTEKNDNRDVPGHKFKAKLLIKRQKPPLLPARRKELEWGKEESKCRSFVYTMSGISDRRN